MAIKYYEQWFDIFNNFAAYAVEIDGVVYPTAEHAYQAAKCTDLNGKKEIAAARSPMECKEISNIKYKYAKDPDWESKKLDVMESVYRAKLAQHPALAEALIKSGNEEIVEDSPVDYFWGCGADGNGENHLGKLWMKLRAELASAKD